MIYASPKQVRLIDSLAAERDPASADHALLVRVAEVVNRQAHGLSMTEARGIITALFALPRRVANSAPAATGYYFRDGKVYVVVENKAKTSTYAKEMVVYRTASGAKRGKWAYRPGVGMDIAASGLVPLTLEAATKLGHLHGVCMVCGRTLDKPISVKAGIGPSCKKRLNA